MAMDMESTTHNEDLYQNKYRIKTARATWYDYDEGVYFITICTADKKHLFGEIADGIMLLSAIGRYAQHCIKQIEQLHENVTVPYHVVMPNHIHLIVTIIESVAGTPRGTVETSQRGVSPNGSTQCDNKETPQCDNKETPQCDNKETPQCDVSTKMRGIANHGGQLSYLIAQYKSAVTRYARQNAIVFAWQSRFHDHIIRNRDEMTMIEDYIQNNVARWETDCFN